MVISIQQHRSTIGIWNAGKTKQSPPILASPAVMGNNKEGLSHTHTHVVNCPWKLHALILCLAFITLTMMTKTHELTTSTSTALTSAPNTLPQTNTSTAVTQGLMPPSGLISHQCLQNLLVIAGAEQHPGISQDPEKTLEEKKNIFAELCANAPCNEVRNIGCMTRSLTPNAWKAAEQI